MTQLLSHDDILRALVDLPAWRCFDRALQARFQAPTFAAAVALVDAVAADAERADHHPDIDIRWRTVRMELTTHSAGGVTTRDVEMAGRVAARAAAVGAVPAGVSPQRAEIAVDTLDPARIRPFWAAAFAAEPLSMPNGAVDLVPADGGPRIWFQQMDGPRPGRNRLHLDVYVPREEAADRLAAVLAAGGRLVSEQFAPEWWVLADADENEICLCVPTE